MSPVEESSAGRAVAVLLHPTRDDALDAAADFVVGLAARGIRSLVREDALEALRARLGGRADVAPLPAVGRPSPDEDGGQPAVTPAPELAVVFGGDGSILRGAQTALPLGIPLLGVNLGHVGFLAELEASQTADLVDQVAERRYEVERRLTLRVQVISPDDEQLWESFAVNEVSVEKIARERMLEVLASIDGRPVSLWGCDGILVSTPTGSTAYAFSAGGPVMWPDVEAIELVPLSAHALFARPLVLSPTSLVDLEVSRERGVPATVWADGARTVDAEPGSRIRLQRGERDLLIARLSEQPFTTRLVMKFGLPVEGFRGKR